MVRRKCQSRIGNILTINDLSKNINGQVTRLALLSSHYKKPLEWNEKLIIETQNTLDKWYGLFEKVSFDSFDNEILSPLLEDLNTPEYISMLHSLYNEAIKGDKPAKLKFLKACNFIGLLEDNKESWKEFKKSKMKVDENFINQKIKDRNNARKKGDYKLADVIRKELEENDIIIEDKQETTKWKYK